MVDLTWNSKRNPPCRGIDHIVLRLAAAEPLYTLLSQTLGLPVPWPLQQSEFATFGWVTLGNTNLELWAASNNSDLPSGQALPLVHGFPLDPTDLASSVAQLAHRGITCKAPRPYQTRNADGDLVTNFTNAVVLDVSSASCCVFFCEWSSQGSIFPWKEKLSTGARQARDQDALRTCGGGQLGIIGLAEIQLASPTPLETADHWRRLTGSQAEPLALTEDIALRILPGPAHLVEALVLRVRSLAATRAFLSHNGLLGVASPGQVSLSRQATGGLNFSFIE